MTGVKGNPLQRRIDALIDDEVEAALVALGPIKSEFIKAGAYNGSRRILVENQSLRKSFQDALVKMARLIHQALGETPEAASLLEESARNLERRFTEHASKAKGHDFNGKLNREFIEKLGVDVENTITEFGFGIAGGEKLKKGAEGNITAMNINSPGATAGAAGRDVRQKVVHATYTNLVGYLDGITSSEEFKKLDGAQQEELRDVIETVREAASEEKPDPNKVTRRGTRLVAFLKELGMTTLASGLIEILKGLASSGAAC